MMGDRGKVRERMRTGTARDLSSLPSPLMSGGSCFVAAVYFLVVEGALSCITVAPRVWCAGAWESCFGSMLRGLFLGGWQKKRICLCS